MQQVKMKGRQVVLLQVVLQVVLLQVVPPAVPSQVLRLRPPPLVWAPPLAWAWAWARGRHP